MADRRRILVTGSADGLGQMAAQRLVAAGHDVVLHGRNEARARDAMAKVPGARAVLVGDLASITETRALAEQANAVGPFDAVIHNAAVGYREPRAETVDGIEHVFAVNVLAPYLLTALIAPPRRLIYLTSSTCSGAGGAGTARRPTRTPSCSTSCSPSRSPAAGRRSCRMPSSPAGSRRKWVAPARPTI